tara:strand:+ start:5770 stop:5961 length:192 start_codon:yes stop_codon:yes gene_type:complete
MVEYKGALKMITKEDMEAMADDTEVQLEFNFVKRKQVLDPYDDAPVVGDAYKQDFSNRDKEPK